MSNFINGAYCFQLIKAVSTLRHGEGSCCGTLSNWGGGLGQKASAAPAGWAFSTTGGMEGALSIAVG